MNRFFPRARLSSRRRRPPKQEPKRRARGARSPDAAGLPMLGRPCPELSARGWQSAVPRWYARSANWADRRSGRPRTRLSSHPSIPPVLARPVCAITKPPRPRRELGLCDTLPPYIHPSLRACWDTHTYVPCLQLPSQRAYAVLQPAPPTPAGPLRPSIQTRGDLTRPDLARLAPSTDPRCPGCHCARG